MELIEMFITGFVNFTQVKCPFSQLSSSQVRLQAKNIETITLSCIYWF